MNQLIAHGEIQRGRLGIGIQDLTPDLAEVPKLGDLRGALIASVEPGSEAAPMIYRSSRSFSRDQAHAAARQPNWAAARVTRSRPIGIAEVAAGEGALQTWMLRAVSWIRKSCTSVPSARTACARMPGR